MYHPKKLLISVTLSVVLAFLLWIFSWQLGYGVDETIHNVVFHGVDWGKMSPAQIGHLEAIEKKLTFVAGFSYLFIVFSVPMLLVRWADLKWRIAVAVSMSFLLAVFTYSGGWRLFM